MFDVELVLGILDQILVAAHRIERRFASIRRPDDFLVSDEGLDRLDGTVEKLKAELSSASHH